MIQFNKEVRRILEEVSPYYKLERLKNGLYKRTYYESGFVGYFKDKEGAIPHRLDGPAFEYSNGNKGYFIEGNLYSEKDYWNAVKLKTPSDFDTLKDLLDV